MKKIPFIFLFSFFVVGLLKADQAEDLYQEANLAYGYNDFEKAIKLYEQVADLGLQSVELEYNLGNAYFKNKEKGKAILHYERALMMSPDEEDVLFNLKTVKEDLDKREVLPDFFLLSWWKNVRAYFSANTWAVFALILWWAGFAGLYFWIKGKTRQNRKWGFFTGLFGIIISLLPFALGYNRMMLEKNSRQAIVLQKDATLRSAPDEVGKEVLDLYEGEKVQLLDFLSGHWRVRLVNGDKGWVRALDVEEI